MLDSPRAAVFGALMVLACGVERTLDTATDATCTASTTVTRGTEAQSGSTTATSGAPTTSTSTAGTSTVVDDDGLCGPNDLSCPAGQKCTNVDRDDDNGFWDGSECVPAAQNGGEFGDPCGFAEGASVWSGLDDCAPGLFCFDFYLETGLGGTCHEYCDEQYDCHLTNGGDAVCFEGSQGLGLLGICFAACDPLLQDCADMEGCYGEPTFPDFICFAPFLDLSPGDRGAACESINACLPGLGCQPSDRVDGCAQDIWGCCTPFCSVAGGPGPCAANEQCAPFYANPPSPDLADVGVCLLPG